MKRYTRALQDAVTQIFSQYMEQHIGKHAKQESEGADQQEDWQSLMVFERPPKVELGDLAVPVFPFAKLFRQNPAAIAESLVAAWPGHPQIREVRAAGPYVNIHYKREGFTEEILNTALGTDNYGNGKSMQDVKVQIEFSSPNTNKPLHLGHLRNNALGESIRRMLSASGASVESINLINDRGIHTCKAMLAYKEQGKEKTPESEGVKPDHFVGEYYVQFEQAAQREPAQLERAQEMLRQWEAGDPGIRKLWDTMRNWALEGIRETYRRTQVHFDNYDFESETYLEGRNFVYKGLEAGLFYRKNDGSIWVDLSSEGLDEKVLLRGDGTALYVTQDIGTIMQRYRRLPFNRHIYVVANEQIYHFQVLFAILKRLGIDWVERLHHRSYGMVNLPEGKMKSREGIVVDADNLLDTLRDMAKQQVREKKLGKNDDVNTTAEAIALGALHYYLLSPNPASDISFDPRKSLSFTGNTGPYLQYTLTRIRSMHQKALLAGLEPNCKANLLDADIEWELLRCIADYPDQVASAAELYNPSIIAHALFTCAQVFSRYYHEHAVVTDSNRDRAASRLALVLAVGKIIRHGLHLLVIPAVEQM